jgi:hypothetical protein
MQNDEEPLFDDKGAHAMDSGAAFVIALLTHQFTEAMTNLHQIAPAG